MFLLIFSTYKCKSEHFAKSTKHPKSKEPKLVNLILSLQFLQHSYYPMH